jgi:hypothetical protein
VYPAPASASYVLPGASYVLPGASYVLPGASASYMMPVANMTYVPQASLSATSFGCQGGSAAGTSQAAAASQAAGVDPLRLLELGLPFLERLLTRSGDGSDSLRRRVDSIQDKVDSLDRRVAALESEVRWRRKGEGGGGRRDIPENPPTGFGAGAAALNPSQPPTVDQLGQATEMMSRSLDALEDAYVSRRKAFDKRSDEWKKSARGQREKQVLDGIKKFLDDHNRKPEG